jgi:RNA polymerase-binding transcription factor DksA
MTKLTQQQIRNLSALMDSRFTREIDELRAVRARTRDEREEGAQGDRSDAASFETTLATDDAVISQDVTDVRDILAARERLAAGTYGICTDCGDAIAYERLLAYPTAKRCIHCQRVCEQGRSVGRILRVSRGGRPTTHVAARTGQNTESCAGSGSLDTTCAADLRLS